MLRRLLLCLIIASSSTLSGQTAWTLQKCIDHAFQYNIQIKQSELSRELAEINHQRAWGAALPNLNGAASHGYNWGQSIDPFTNTFATERIQTNSFGLSTGITLFNGFQILNNYKQSKIGLIVSNADLDKMKNDVALNIANAFLNVLFNKEFEKIAVANLGVTQQQVDRIAKLVSAGQLPQGSLSEIEAQLALEEANLIASENNLDLAYLALTQLLQLDHDESRNFEIADPDLDDLGDIKLVGDARTAVNIALNSFPEIKSAESSVISAQQGVDIAKGSMSPSLTASYSYGTGYSGANQQGIGDPIEFAFPIGTVGTAGDLVYSLPQASFLDFETKPFGDQLNDNLNQSLTFRMSVPIFNGFNTKSNIQQAQVQLKSSEFALEGARQTLEQNVERAYADAKASLNNYRATEKAVEASQRALDYATVRFEEGVINSVDYLDARTRLDNAKAEMVRTKYDYVFKTKLVEFYMGQPITFR